MPKEAFFKLKYEKQLNIIASAEKEFMVHTTKEASINNIIKNADISRGSFYLYFENLEDLYNYILTNIRNNIVESVKKEILSNKSLFEVGLSLFDKFVYQYTSMDTDKEIVERIIKELNPEMIMFFVKGFDDENPLIFTKLSDFKKLNIKSANDFKVILEIVICYVCEKICEIYVDYCSIDEAKKDLIRMFEYLKKSFYK